MSLRVWRAFRIAVPIMTGYLFLGIPCGILSAAAGFNWQQVALLSILLYSGTGQYMLANMMLAGISTPAMVISIILVSTRHILYSVGVVKVLRHESLPWQFLAACNITDESFGINIGKYQTDESWRAQDSFCVNMWCHAAWAGSCIIGALCASLVSIPSAIAAFAMSAIFICLLCMQDFHYANSICVLVVILGVIICKLFGLDQLAILISAALGVGAGMLVQKHKAKAGKEALSS